MKKAALLIAIVTAQLVVVFIIGYSPREKTEIFADANFKEPPVVESRVLYTGKIYHIFFHSLIVYPELAYTGDGESKGYETYMITRDQFSYILENLYKNNFVLISIKSIYEEKEGGIYKKDLYLPEGKKPLLISLDDLSYYHTMNGRGFANKLILDNDGEIATEITDPGGVNHITYDGDVVPILDKFVKEHPDYSIDGAKGIIALTGFEGILGYRTNLKNPRRNEEITKVTPIVRKLKETGWEFASHSYTHDQGFLTGSITLDELKSDTERWLASVGEIVGDTNIFIGPFGQIFKPNDARRNYLVSKGFNILNGVGMDLYLEYFPNYLVMNRADIDGYRISQTPWLVKEYFDPDGMPER